MTSTARSKRRRAGMTKLQRTRERTRYATKRRVDLVRKLSPGGKCWKCGRKFELPELTIHHEDGRWWDASRVSPQVRHARYWREHLAGVRLRAVCGSCNSSMGCPRRNKRGKKPRKNKRN